MNITIFKNHSWHADLFKDPISRWSIVTMHLLITTVGITLNVLICVSHYVIKTPLKKFSICFVNLCVTNIVMLLGFLPLLIIDIHKTPVLSTEFLSDMFCGFVQGQSFAFVGIFCGIHTLCVMSVARYLAVRRPFRLGISKNDMRKLLCFDWFVCVLLHIPNTCFWRNYNGYCYRLWKWGTAFKIAYVLILYVAGLFIPIIIMVTSFSLTSWEFFNGKMTSTETVKRKYRKRIILLTGALVIIWLLSHIPYSIYWLLTVIDYFSFSYEGEIYRQKWKWYAYFPAMVNGVLDPILFGAFSSEFKKSIRGSVTPSLRNARDNIL